MNSANILPDDLPWPGCCTDTAEVNEEYIFCGLDQRKQINLKFSFSTSSVFCTSSRVLPYSGFYSMLEGCVNLETRSWERMNEKNLGQRWSNFFDFALCTAPLNHKKYLTGSIYEVDRSNQLCVYVLTIEHMLRTA